MDFFYKVIDEQILFRLDSQGRANALILRQSGTDMLAQWVGGITEPVTEWFGHKESPVDRAVLDNYIGRYQIGPGAVFTVIAIRQTCIKKPFSATGFRCKIPLQSNRRHPSRHIAFYQQSSEGMERGVSELQ